MKATNTTDECSRFRQVLRSKGPLALQLGLFFRYFSREIRLLLAYNRILEVLLTE